jgi:hypothetical protein
METIYQFKIKSWQGFLFFSQFSNIKKFVENFPILGKKSNQILNFKFIKK